MIRPIIPILLIEDNPGDVMLIREMLAGSPDHRFEVLEAGMLSTGLELLQKNHSGIVLLDLSLPDSSGLDTLQKVLAQCQKIPVIVLTGLNDDKLGINSVIQGAQDYLVKGETDHRVLIKAIKYAIERKHLELRQGLIAGILSTLNRPNNWSMLIRDILHQIKDFTGHEAVGIRLRKEEDYPYYYAIGYTDNFLDSAQRLSETDARLSVIRDKEGKPRLACLCGQVIEGGTDPSQPFFTPNGSFWTNDLPAIVAGIESKSPAFFIRGHCLGAGYRSMALIPVKSRNEIVGLLQFMDTHPGRFTPEAIRFLEEVGETIGIAFQRITHETEIKQSEAKYRDIVTFAPVGIYQSTRDGKILSANQELANLLGYASPEDILKLNMSKDLYYDESQRQQIISIYEPINAVKNIDLTWKRKDGVPVWISLTAHAVKDEQGNTLYFEGFVSDATKRMKIETELVSAKEKAEESDRLKTSLLNNMSHEFRTPMNAILGFSSLIENDTPDPGYRDVAQRIHSAASRLMKTLDDILELSQLRNYALPEDTQPVDIYTELAGLISRYRNEAGKKQIQVNYSPKCHPLVAISQEHFVRLMDHLVENAIKFTKQGSIAIEIRETGAGGENRAEIAVSDTGIGIAPEHIKLIFEEFRQVSEGYARTYEGSGLGLSIASRIVKMYGGLINAESEPGKGSTFTVSFPSLAKEPVEEPKTETPLKDRPFQEKSSGIQVPFRKPDRESIHILIVEDNEDNVDITKFYLNDKAAMDVAFNAELALGKVKEKQFDVILMDINLGPGKNGLDATREIRGVAGYEKTPIIAVTGYTMVEDKEKIFAAGCTHYLGKPFTKAELLSKVGEALQ